MATKKKTVGLNWYADQNCWRKTIGTALNKAGSPAPKVWYWAADDEETGLAEAAALKARWKALTASGKKLWDEEDQYQREHVHKQQRAADEQRDVVTVADGADRYLKNLEADAEAGQIVRKHHNTQSYRLKFAINLPVNIGSKQFTLAKLPLSCVGADELEAVIRALAARPMVTHDHYLKRQKKDGKTPAGKPRLKKMSASYAEDCTNVLKWALNWLAGRGFYTKPRNWDEVWKKKVVLNRVELVQQLQDDGQDVEHFTLDELKRIWVATLDAKTDYHVGYWRLLILLGMNCGFANEECADLKQDEVKQELDADGKLAKDANGLPLIWVERYRGKTVKRAGHGAYGKWRLWRPTILLLDKYRAVANPENYWLLSEDQRKLTANNSIGQGWRRLTKRAGVRELGFKFLRKTFAHFITHDLGFGPIEGKGISNMLLSHADQSMHRFYAGRPWETICRDAVERLERHLTPMFNATLDDFPDLQLRAAKNKPVAVDDLVHPKHWQVTAGLWPTLDPLPTSDQYPVPLPALKIKAQPLTTTTTSSTPKLRVG